MFPTVLVKCAFSKALNHTKHFLSKAYSTASMTPLKEVIKTLQKIAPLELAGSWDNVGLLVEPTEDIGVNKVLLTIDLTEDVVDEAIETQSELIVSYHPNIFKPLKTVNQKHWKERVITKCIKNNIAVFSPHTSWDSMENGVNDWLASALKPKSSKPISANPDDPRVGMGRLITLPTPLSLRKAIEDIKVHIGIPHLRVGIARHRDIDHHVSTVGLCAGSGTSVLSGVEADLYVTGEMLHHDILDATQRGISVILCNHTDSERGFLKVFQSSFSLGDVRVLVSKVDRDSVTTY